LSSKKQKLHKFILPKLKFASTSFIASTVDYTLYLLLVHSGLPKAWSNVISMSCGMLVNFLLQKRFIFNLRRKVSSAFIISISFSILGIGISTLLIYLISIIPFFNHYQFITKLIVMGIMFFYNFYTKKLAFEKKVEW
jgi:putative flippase GtrA